jgi:fimbrial isopeptide formation D2 family protein
MTKNLRSVIAFILSVMMLLAMSCTSFAASTDTIDEAKTGSITIHKYDLTAAEKGGVDVSQFTASGEADSAAAQALNPYALKGVEFSYTRVGGITNNSKHGKVNVIYNIPATLCSILGLSNADAEVIEGSKLYFTSDKLNTALAELLSDNTAGKDKLEAWAKQNKLNAMPETDETGTTSASNLELGLYMMIETKVPQNVYSTTNPCFICVPMTDKTGDYWFYDVVVYPKNQSNDPTLDKLVSEDGTYADTASVSEGDTLDYRLVSHLPYITSTATYLSKYTYVDELTRGLAYGKDVTISFYDSESDAKNATGTALATWSDQSNPTLFDVAYESSQGGTRMTIKPTKDGFREMNTKYSGKYMVVAYTAKVKSTADMVCGDSGNENDVKLTYGRTNTTYTETLEDKALVYTFGLNLTKTFSDNQGNAEKVKFVLQNRIDDYFVTATGENGEYYVTGQAKEEKDATVLSPSKDGSLKVHGLEADTYLLTEIGTDAGYALLKGKITIEIYGTDTTIVPSIAPVTGLGSEQENCEVTMNKSAFAIVDNTDASMSAHGDSANALVDMKIENTRTFTLPQTGGRGLWLITICGVVGVAFGVVLMRKGKSGSLAGAM